jgi:hypothetical protein
MLLLQQQLFLLLSSKGAFNYLELTGHHQLESRRTLPQQTKAVKRLTGHAKHPLTKNATSPYQYPAKLQLLNSSKLLTSAVIPFPSEAFFSVPDSMRGMRGGTAADLAERPFANVGVRASIVA